MEVTDSDGFMYEFPASVTVMLRMANREAVLDALATQMSFKAQLLCLIRRKVYQVNAGNPRIRSQEFKWRIDQMTSGKMKLHLMVRLRCIPDTPSPVQIDSCLRSLYLLLFIHRLSPQLSDFKFSAARVLGRTLSRNCSSMYMIASSDYSSPSTSSLSDPSSSSPSRRTKIKSS